MNHLDILEQYPEFAPLFNFLICYFVDDREGKTEDDIVATFVQENSAEYILSVQKILEQFVTSGISLDVKHAMLDATNLYFKTGQDMIEWIQMIKHLLENSRR